MSVFVNEPMLRPLKLALGRLEFDQGPVARRNARSAVARTIRALKRRIDQEYPAIKKTRMPKRRRTGAQVDKARLANGWTQIANFNQATSALVSKLEQAGVTVWRKQSGTFVPTWAFEMARHERSTREISLARRFIKMRKAALVEIALEKGVL